MFILNSIGIRVTPKQIYFTIANKDTEGNISIYSPDKLIVPQSLDIPNCLTFIRTNLISIINEYNVKLGAIRIIEGNSQTKDTFRINMEGVIQELFANSSVESYFCGTINSLSKRLRFKQADIKDALDSKKSKNIFKLDYWDKFKKEEKESILFSIAALH